MASDTIISLLVAVTMLLCGRVVVLPKNELFGQNVPLVAVDANKVFVTLAITFDGTIVAFIDSVPFDDKILGSFETVPFDGR